MRLTAKEESSIQDFNVTHSDRLMKKVKIFFEVLSTPSVCFPFGVLRSFLIAEAKISWENVQYGEFEPEMKSDNMLADLALTSPAFCFMLFLLKRSQPHDHIAWQGYRANTFLRISATFLDVSSFVCTTLEINCGSAV